MRDTRFIAGACITWEMPGPHRPWFPTCKVEVVLRRVGKSGLSKGLVRAQETRGAVIVIVAAVAMVVLQLTPILAGCGVSGLCFGACHSLPSQLSLGDRGRP